MKDVEKQRGNQLVLEWIENTAALAGRIRGLAQEADVLALDGVGLLLRIAEQRVWKERAHRAGLR